MTSLPYQLPQRRGAPTTAQVFADRHVIVRSIPFPRSGGQHLYIFFVLRVRVNRPAAVRPFAMKFRGADVPRHPHHHRVCDDTSGTSEQTLLRPFCLLSNSVVGAESPFQDNCKHGSCAGSGHHNLYITSRAENDEIGAVAARVLGGTATIRFYAVGAAQVLIRYGVAINIASFVIRPTAVAVKDNLGHKRNRPHTDDSTGQQTAIASLKVVGVQPAARARAGYRMPANRRKPVLRSCNSQYVSLIVPPRNVCGCGLKRLPLPVRSGC